MALNREKLDVPTGFRNLLEGLTLEVLRAKPTNIPKFAAEYFKKRLILRQERGYDECLLGSQIDGFYRYEPNRSENTNKLVDAMVQDASVPPSSFMRKEDACFHGYEVRQEVELRNSSAEKIQAGYRGYACRKHIKKQKEAATKIQAGFRAHQVRRGEENKRNTEGNRQTGIHRENKAATKIQARFRGYQVRKGSTRTNTSLSCRHSNGGKLHQKLTDEQEAATRIQAGYRGYRDRKEIARQYRASSKIQAGYRGYRGRKELKIKQDASVKIQAAYRGYHDREELKTKHEASTAIQSAYRGYRARKIKNDQSKAAVKIQAQYRGYRVRTELKHGGDSQRHQTNLLDIAHQDSRFSFSLPQDDVEFEGNLDSDSDTDIDKVVKMIEDKKTEMKKNKKDSANGDTNQV